MVAEGLSPDAGDAARIGRSFPLGASIVGEGVNFSVFSRGASAVESLLFERDDDARPARVIPIDPAANRTYHYWDVLVPGVGAGQLYGYRVYGDWEPARHRRKACPFTRC